MNRKQLTILLAAVVVLGGLGYWVRSRDTASFRTSTGTMGQKVLGEFDINSVGQVLIKHGSNQVNLVKAGDVWTVKERGNYPANYSEVGENVRKLWDLKTVQPVAIGPSQLPRLELDASGDAASAATLVELRDASGKRLKALLLGKKHNRQGQGQGQSQFGGDEGWPDGRYVMPDAQPPVVSLVSETFTSLEPKPEQWLNKDFFKVEKVKSVALAFPAASNSWTVTRETETGEFKLTDAKPEEKLDASKVSGVPSALSFPSFNDVVVDAKPEQTGLDKATVASIQTFEGFKYTVKVGAKSGEDAYYLSVAVDADLPKERTPGKDEKPEDKDKLDKEFKDKTQKLADKLKQEKGYEKSVYLVSKWTVDGLLKERAQLLAEKKDEPAKDGASAGDGGVPPLPVAIPSPLPPGAGLVPATVVPPPAPTAGPDPAKALPPVPPTPSKEEKPKN